MSEIESPAAPVIPDAPTAPEPAAPVAPHPVAPAPADDVQQPTGDESELSKEELDEWDAAADEIFPGLKSVNQKKEEKKSDEPEKRPEESETTTTTTTIVPPETTVTTTIDPSAETAKTGDEETGEPDTSVRDSRAIAREAAQQLEDVKAGIRAQLFADVETPTLKDKDGNEIKSPLDVMQYINPATKTEENPEGRLFTQDEAQQWLDYQNSENQKKVAAHEQEVEQIANVTIRVADEADAIGDEFGELLKADPKLKADLWAGYRQTLKMRRGKDAEGNDIDIIVDAPVSLDKYYRPILEKYAETARQLEKEADDRAVQEQAEKDRLEKERKENRQDRSPIYGGGQSDITSDESKEWDSAAAAVYTPEQLNQLNKR